ncbi:hypothetical protein NE236_41990 [Actinoallomurus purpureus]|uniref:hypothetical protein n=1 Tax=Actinoallomurus purpureus TaxID=478114 RepID=UPI0020934C9E|nr:hypothetical protein [Actinoallomurus purpureus]MCO6011543.1 hypothetical protein [Actinoallomurus purpureus]
MKFQPPEVQAVTGRVVPALRIPDPQDPETDDDTLTDAEQKRLEAYEAVFERHREAFWEEGKALAGIVKGHLHRRDYPSLEAYLEARWGGMSRTVAYRRIELWQVGERLSPMGDINERQARALKPYADKHGFDAMETVYRTIVETDGVKVTAKLVEDAVGALPDGEFNEKKTVERVRAFLAGKVKPAIPGPAPAELPSPGEQVEKFRAVIRRIRVDRLRAADPAARQELADELRQLLAALENVGE